MLDRKVNRDKIKLRAAYVQIEEVIYGGILLLTKSVYACCRRNASQLVRTSAFSSDVAVSVSWAACRSRMRYNSVCNVVRRCFESARSMPFKLYPGRPQIAARV